MADQYPNEQFFAATKLQDETYQMVDTVSTNHFMTMDIDATDLSTMEDVPDFTMAPTRIQEPQVPQVDAAVGVCSETVMNPVSAVATTNATTSTLMPKPEINVNDLVVVPNDIHFTAAPSPSFSWLRSQPQGQLQLQKRQRLFAAKTLLMEHEENQTRRKRVASKSVSPGGQRLLLNKVVSQEDILQPSNQKTTTTRNDRIRTSTDTNSYKRTSTKIKPPSTKKGPASSSLKKGPAASSLKKGPASSSPKRGPTPSSLKKGPASSSLKKGPTSSSPKRGPTSSTPQKGPKTATKKNTANSFKAGKEVYRGPPTEDNMEGGWPPGWVKTHVQRMSGTYAGNIDRYWYSPGGKKFRSMIEVKKFFVALSLVAGDEEEAFRIFKSIRL